MTVGEGQGSLPGGLGENRAHSAARGGKASSRRSDRGGRVIPGHFRNINQGRADIVLSTGGATPKRRIGHRVAPSHGTGGVSGKFAAPEGCNLGNAGRRIYGEAVGSRLGALIFTVCGSGIAR